jgi:hypothetical protein
VARLKLPPALISHQSVNPPMTETGEDRFVVVLSPNCPLEFDPQAQVKPFCLTPSEWLCPADT